MKNLYSLFFLALLISCASEEKMDLYRLELPEAIEVVPELVSDEILTQAPVQILVDSTSLIFMKPSRDQTLFFINKKTLETYNWGRMGSGPDDFISPECIQQDGQMWRIWDVNLRKIIDYKVLYNGNIPQLIPQKRMKISSEKMGGIMLIDLHVMDNGCSV